LGYGRSRRLRPTSPAFISRLPRYLDMLRHRLVRGTGKHSRQGMPGTDFPTADALRPDKVHQQWISEVLHFCPDTPIILVGCKTDLRYREKVGEKSARLSQTAVTPEQVSRTSDPSPQRILTCDFRQGEAMRKKIGALKYVECSAKYNHGISRVFEVATRAALLTQRGRPFCKFL
jgi:hypothetical protein